MAHKACFPNEVILYKATPYITLFIDLSLCSAVQFIINSLMRSAITNTGLLGRSFWRRKPVFPSRQYLISLQHWLIKAKDQYGAALLGWKFTNMVIPITEHLVKASGLPSFLSYDFMGLSRLLFRTLAGIYSRLDILIFLMWLSDLHLAFSHWLVIFPTSRLLHLNQLMISSAGNSPLS